jgi:hypothetical protein
LTLPTIIFIIFFPFLQKPSLNSDAILPALNILDLGAKGNGVDDDTPYIQRGIDSVKKTGGTLLFPYTRHSYIITRSLTIEGGRNIRLLGDPMMRTKFTLRGDPFKGIYIRRSKNISLLNLEIIGSGVKKIGSDAAGIKIALCDSVTIINVSVSNATTNGIEGILSNYCIVSQCTVTQTKNYNGIGWTGGYKNIYEGNICTYNRGQGIEIRSQQSAIVKKNYCAFNGEPGEQSSGITVEAEDGYIQIERVIVGKTIRIITTTRHGYASGETIEIPIYENGTFQSTKIKILEIGEKHFDIAKLEKSYHLPAGLTLLYSNRSIAEVAFHSENILVEDNICVSNNGYGIYIISDKMARVRNITIKSNKIEDNIECGIFIASGVGVQEYRTTSNITIINNHILRNGIPLKRWGIWVYFADSVYIFKNTVAGNGNSDNIRNSGGLLLKNE